MAVNLTARRIKRNIKEHTPEIIVTVGLVAFGIATAVYFKNPLKSPLTEPDRLAGPNMIVLENVLHETITNLWRDMDEPMNTYVLVPFK